jgi:sec-independent protein translocase protein TatB
MFDISWSELLITAIVAIVVVGPKDLPRLMRKFGHYEGRLRHMANEFKQQVDEAMAARSCSSGPAEHQITSDLRVEIECPA